MEPFHVICETCHARLKIRKASVIGEIHACPKCESMVHIVPPPGWTPPAESLGGISPATDLVDVSLSESPVAGATSPLWMWALGGAAVATAVSLTAIMMWARGGTADVTSATVVAAARPAPTSPDPPEIGAEAQPAETTIAVTPPTESPADISLETSVTPQSVAELPAEDAMVAEEPDEASTETAAAVETVAGAVATAAADASPSPADAVRAADERKPVMKFDPLDFDPDQLSLGAADSHRDPAAGSAANTDALEMSRPVVTTEGEEPMLAEPQPDDATVTVRVGPSPTAAAVPRDVSAQLAVTIESLEMQGAPLVKLVGMAADMADVPITIDPAALVMTGISPRAPLDVAARGTTLDRMLRDALARRRLDVVKRDGQLMIVRTDADDRRTVDYDVKDLLEAGANDAASIAKLIEQFVAPESWHNGPGEGKITVEGAKVRVEQVNRVQIEVLLFCERLRLARGLAPRSRYPAERLSIVSPYERLAPVLGKQTTFTFLPWTRLADVVRHWQESTGVTMLVDWPALAAKEFAPSTPITCSVIDKRWDEALDAVLEPLGLTWWAVDGETIQITSHGAVNAIRQVAIYPVPEPLRTDDASSGSVVDGIAKELAEQVGAGDAHALEPTRIEVDAASGRVMVCGPPRAHRFIVRQLSGNAEPQAR